MKLIRTLENDWLEKFLTQSFHEFGQVFLFEEFWGSDSFKNYNEYSRFCEEALTNALNLLVKEDPFHYVDRARCNPTFTIEINDESST